MKDTILKETYLLLKELLQEDLQYVVLFGSQMNEQSHLNSDYDVLLIVLKNRILISLKEKY